MGFFGDISADYDPCKSFLTKKYTEGSEFKHDERSFCDYLVDN